MARSQPRGLVGLALLVSTLTGCQSMSPTSSPEGFPSRLPDGWHTNVGAEWPLKFHAHYFGVHCFDTQSCRVVYGGFPHGGGDIPSPSVASYGRPLESLLTAGRGPIPNFPPPAKVTWRSRDGQAHEADIDIGQIFQDQLIRHHVAREDASDPVNSPITEIILEVNDRTINVYTRTTIWLKRPRFPDKPLSNMQRDLIQVFSQTY